MLPLLALAAALGTPPCWDIFDSALRRSASTAHPPYVSYNEHIHLHEGSEPLYDSIAYVDYRDDGMLRVRDERFAFQPIVTRRWEPGPPELGPYGKRRWAWVPQSPDLPVIAEIRTEGNVKCTLADTESYKGHTAYHLEFSGMPANKPSLKAIWVDKTSYDVWKLIASGYVTFADDPDAPPGIADFQVELAYDGPYLLVNHVVWQYDRRVYSQTAKYFGEYTFDGYSFPRTMPPEYFATTAAARNLIEQMNPPR